MYSSTKTVKKTDQYYPSHKTLATFSKYLLMFTVLISVFGSHVTTAEAQSVTSKFTRSKITSSQSVQHSAFTNLLKQYVKTDNSGLNRVNYKALKSSQAELKAYIKSLENTKVTKLSANEQFAYWANLYNALTLNVVLEAYPVKSIKDIDISPGLFADGPWGKKLVTIEGTQISLDDIEHQILRKNFRDPRVHYAVNCASVGCPNLLTEAFTGAKLNAQLNKAASDYINSPRGVQIKNNRIATSKIYQWFKKDFANEAKAGSSAFSGSDAGVLSHLAKYAKSDVKQAILKIGAINSTFYDWSLNDQSR